MATPPQVCRLYSKSSKNFLLWQDYLQTFPKVAFMWQRNSQRFKNAVLDTFGFPEGKLPVRYLGVLVHLHKALTNYIPLVDNITSRIKSWIAQFLSFAGWIQLIQAVLHSIQSYWNGLFILPKKVIHQVEQLLQDFFEKEWSYLVEEGGLGIKRLDTWNVASMSTISYIVLGLLGQSKSPERLVLMGY